MTSSNGEGTVRGRKTKTQEPPISAVVETMGALSGAKARRLHHPHVPG